MRSGLELQRQYFGSYTLPLHFATFNTKSEVNAGIHSGNSRFVGRGLEALEGAWPPATVVVGVVGETGFSSKYLA